MVLDGGSQNASMVVSRWLLAWLGRRMERIHDGASGHDAQESKRCLRGISSGLPWRLVQSIYTVAAVTRHRHSSPSRCPEISARGPQVESTKTSK